MIEYLTLKELCKRYNVGYQVIYRLIKSKQLDYVKIGNQYRVTNVAMEEYINNNK